MHKDWIAPDWLVPGHVRSLITTRSGGVSTGPYASFNVGLSTGDDARAVESNRARLRTLLPGAPRWLKQVHGARVIDADAAAERPEGDAAIARTPGNVCALLIADCLPVLLTNRKGSVVAAAHAGWRGLAAGVIDNTVAAMIEAGPATSDLVAYIGPGIGPRRFEVGDDVYETYTERDISAAEAFTAHGNGKWLADLPALARRALKRCGVTAIYGGELCTYSNPARFYSYRRDKVTGRMAALIWIQH